MKAFYTKTQPKLNKKGIKEPSAPSKISSNWCYFWCFSFFFFKPILFSAASMKSGSLNALVKLDFIVLTYVHIYTCRLYICTYVCSRFHSNFTMFTFHFVCSLRFISLPSRTHNKAKFDFHASWKRPSRVEFHFITSIYSSVLFCNSKSISLCNLCGNVWTTARLFH